MKVPQYKAREWEIQKLIVDAIQLTGLVVYETTAYRQKGETGVDKGIPDLLVCSNLFPHIYLGLEVKVKNGKFSSPEQEQAYREARFFLVHSPEEAFDAIDAWLDQMTASKQLGWSHEAMSALRAKVQNRRKSVEGK